jgi:dimethylargininase
VAVVIADLAILTRPGIESRRQEVDSAHQALQALGLRTTRIQPPGTLDGGDVLQSGDDVLIGHSRRTNEAGIEQLRALVEPLGRRVTVCTVTGCLHLKTGVTALPDGSLLATPGWVDLTGVRRPVHIAPESAGSDVLLVGEGIVLSAAAPATADLLARLGFDTHPVDLTEFEAVEAGPTCLSILIPPSAGSTGR